MTKSHTDYQTAQALVSLLIFGGFVIYVDGGVDGFEIYVEESNSITTKDRF